MNPSPRRPPLALRPGPVHSWLMAFDEDLAARTREAVHERVGPDGANEIPMFGGLAFMVNTHMACGLMGSDLMVRVGKEGHAEAIGRGAQEMDFTGRPMRGIVVVRGPLLAEPEALYGWVGVGVAYAQSQPPKPPKKPKGAHRS